MKVEISNLTKQYGNITAVNDLDLVAEEGELTTLLGPSGCGKTTTLRCIAGLERPDAGTITIGDERVNDVENGVFVSTQQRGIGFIFQSFDVWPHMTVFENVAYPLEIRDYSDDEVEERVQEVLELADIGDLVEKEATNLSGGQQARVGLCRALVYEPKILLCDEPLSGLDRNLRNTMRHEIRRIQSELDITTIYVTHSQPEAMAISDKICLMNTNGKIEQMGTPEEIYQQPVSEYAFNFVGASQTLSATVRSDEEVETTIGPIACDASNVDGEVVLGFRPEDIEMQFERPESWTENAWEGAIENKYYLGDVYEFDIRVGDELIQSRVSIEEYRRKGLEEALGATIQIHLPRNNVFAFAASDQP
jgi:iron(III) transport system ATP-binding protein